MISISLGIRRVQGFVDQSGTFYETEPCPNPLDVLQSSAQHLDNCIQIIGKVRMYKELNDMVTKICRAVMIDGAKKWIRANTEQEYADKLGKLYKADVQKKEKHNFKDYAENWFETYSKPNIASVTQTTYRRQLNKYLIPAFGEMAIEDIGIDDIQRLFNDMSGAKSTKDKTKVVLNMILEMALDDGLIVKNPLKSKRLKITGEASKETPAYAVAQIQYLIAHIGDIKRPQDRVYLALQALHPLRLEEVLGLQIRDIDVDNMMIHIERAVTHPQRNAPEVKAPKTEASKRNIGLSAIALEHIPLSGDKDDFILGGKTPLSYQQVRRMCERIKADTGFDDDITPRRFRTTVLTDIYNATKDVKAAQAAAGHTTSAMTLKHYVKGRESAQNTASVIDALYGVNEAEIAEKLQEPKPANACVPML